MLTAPAGLLPASFPVDCTRGLFNYPVPTISSGPAICLPAPTRPADLLHEVIFHQAAPSHAAFLVAAPATSPRRENTEVRVIDVSATVVEKVDQTPIAPLHNGEGPTQASGAPHAEAAPQADSDATPSKACDPSAAPSGDVALFQYGNTRLAQLTTSQRSSFTLAVERLMDSALAFLLDEIDNGTQSKAGLSFFSALNAIRVGKSSAATPNNRPKREPLQPYRGPVSDDRHRAEIAHFARLMKDLADIDVAGSGQSDDTRYIDGEHRYRLYSGYGETRGITVERRVGKDWRFTHTAFTRGELKAALAMVDADYEQMKMGAGRFASPFAKRDPSLAVEDRVADRIRQKNLEAAKQVASKIFGPNVGQNVSVANG